MSAGRNRQWRLMRRPMRMVQTSDFEFTDSAIPALQHGQILVRNVYLSIDPTQRLWAREEASYMPPVPLGEVMRGIAAGVVEQSRNPKFPTGTGVSGLFGMQDYAVSVPLPDLEHRIDRINRIFQDRQDSLSAPAQLAVRDAPYEARERTGSPNHKNTRLAGAAQSAESQLQSCWS